MLPVSAMYSCVTNHPFYLLTIMWVGNLGLAWLGWPIVLTSLRASRWLAGLGGTYLKILLLVCIVVDA